MVPRFCNSVSGGGFLDPLPWWRWFTVFSAVFLGLHAATNVCHFDVTMTKPTANCQASLSQDRLNSSYMVRIRVNSYIATTCSLMYIKHVQFLVLFWPEYSYLGPVSVRFSPGVGPCSNRDMAVQKDRRPLAAGEGGVKFHQLGNPVLRSTPP